MSAFNNAFDRAYEKVNQLPPVYFANRKEELKRLYTVLIEKDLPMVNICGEEGIGKSALANHFYHEHLDLFSLSLNFTSERIIHIGNNSYTHNKSKIKYFLEIIELNEGGKIPDIILPKVVTNTIGRQPSKKIILSRKELTLDCPIIRLDQLSLKDMKMIWESNFLSLKQNEFKELYKLSKGNPLIGTLLGRLVRDGHSLEFLSKRARNNIDFIVPGLVDQYGNEINTEIIEENNIVSELVIANDKIIRYFESHPEKIHQLKPRQFEEFVAELLERIGYSVELTPISKDGGKDIYVAQQNALGKCLYVVECKKYAPENRVGVKIVRELYGTVEAEKLTGGIIATTSDFTKSAKEFSQNLEYKLSLKSYTDIKNWIKIALKKGRQNQK